MTPELMLFVITGLSALALTLVACLFAVHWQRGRQEAVREEARRKMLEHWARQELDTRTVML